MPAKVIFGSSYAASKKETILDLARPEAANVIPHSKTAGN